MGLTESRQSEIDSCLAYEVLRHPEKWIGDPSPRSLEAFLIGATYRADFSRSDFPDCKIDGVLWDPEFYQPFIKATGHPTLPIRWASALEFTHFSQADAFAQLRESALAWHMSRGLAPNPGRTWSSKVDAEEYWPSLAKRPAMYMGKSDGWTLHCFLSGMDGGGDWLELPEMPRMREIFDKIKANSERSYGSPFGAFRVYEAQTLLEWGLAE